MPFEASAFQRLLEPLDRRVFGRMVARHDGDRGVGKGSRAWTCWRHCVAMVFAQVAGLDSLREIEHGLSANPGGLYHVGLRMPYRSTLSDAQANRPAAVFRDVGLHLMGLAQRTLRRELGEVVELIDSTPIPLRDPRFGWAEADNRIRGLKVHVGYDARAGSLEWAEVTSPRTSDVVAARTRNIVPGRVYVFDKGYLDFNWWRRLHEGQAFFVSRLKSNTKRRDVVAQQAKGEGILEDNHLKIGHAKPRGGAHNLLYDVAVREIVVEREGKDPLRLVTNDLDRPASQPNRRPLQGTLASRTAVQVAEAKPENPPLPGALGKCRQNPDLRGNHHLPAHPPVPEQPRQRPIGQKHDDTPCRQPVHQVRPIQYISTTTQTAHHPTAQPTIRPRLMISAIKLRTAMGGLLDLDPRALSQQSGRASLQPQAPMVRS